MKAELLTVAELIQTARGLYLPEDVNRTAAEAEVLYEAQWDDATVERFEGTVEPFADGDPHVYSMGEAVHAEEALFLSLQAEQRTKMILSRFLQRSQAFERGETLRTVWSSTKADLERRVNGVLAPPVPRAPRRRARANR